MAKDNYTDSFDDGFLKTSGQPDSELDGFSPDFNLDAFLSDLDKNFVSDSKQEEPSDPFDLSFLTSDASLADNPSPATQAAARQASAKAKQNAPDRADKKAVKAEAAKSEKKAASEKKAPPEKPARQPKEKSPHRFHALNLLLLLTALVLTGSILFVLYINHTADPFNGKILQNVHIAGVDVGGMTKEEALLTVKSAIGSSYFDNNMVVDMGTIQLVLPAANTYANLNASEAVNNAYALGRSGTAEERQNTFKLSQSSVISLDITSALGLNTDYIRGTLEAELAKVSGEFVPSGYTLEGAKPALDADSYSADAPCQVLQLTVGHPGSRANADAIFNMVIEAYSQHNFLVEVPADYVAVFPEALDLEAIYNALYVAPVEASENPNTKESIPGSCGYSFSLETAKQLVSSANYGDVVSVPMEYIVPANLEFSGSYSETLGKYSTKLSDSDAYNENMKKICKALNGVVLEPGQSFSFYSLIGNRTNEKGYVSAVRHAGYCLAEETGGGTDQVASTLYVAAMLSDLAVPEKHYADHACGYTISGTELTVSQAWQDLKLRNDFSQAVMIRAKVTDTDVVISILGQEALDYYIKVESEPTYVYTAGTVVLEKPASSGYTNNQVLLEGLDGGGFKLYRIKCSKADDKELSRQTEYLELPSAPKTIVTVR